MDQSFGSNAVRLSGRQWGLAALALVCLYVAVPAAWRALESFEPDSTYRVPYGLSEDYWHFKRYAAMAARSDAVLVVGDSVVWGEYVDPDQTLSAHLSGLSEGTSFQNLGINGIHPAALYGLIRYYGCPIEKRRVILHFNALWMSSPRHDLSADKEFRFNHPLLVPQFRPRIPCYKDPYGDRLGVAMGRMFPGLAWARHVSITCFDSMDLVVWAQQNPGENPLGRIKPAPDVEDEDAASRHKLVPWTEAGMKPTNFQWVDPKDSIQWRMFRETVELLRDRGNDVFVVLGPFNEHMLTEESLALYESVKTEAVSWLQSEGIPHFAPDALPSDLYADASHPLSQGYALLAGQLLAHPSEGGRFIFSQPVNQGSL